MRKIFVDCGGHDRCSIRKFTATHEGFECFTFEPNVDFAPYYADLPTTLINKAVWTKDGPVDFYLGGKSMEGSSVFANKYNIDLNKRRVVECVDLSRWLAAHVTPEDYVVLKLDVECAEYDILTKLMNDSTLNLVDELFVEFHWRKHKVGISPEQHSYFMGRLNEWITPKDWDALEYQVYGR